MPKPPAHYNPSPRFGLVTEDVAHERWEAGWMRYYEEEAERNGVCTDCGETFRYDDCGGYNPPCECGMHCRSCHEHEAMSEADWDDDYERDEESYPDAYDWRVTPSSAGSGQ